MKGILGLLRQRSQAERSGEEQLDSVMFTTAFADQGVDPSLLVPWEARATEVGAKKLNAERATKILQSLWAKDKYMSHLDDHAIHSLQMFFEFALVPAGRDIIRQDEYGNFMVVLLNGNIAVDRLQPWGERMRLAETRPGDILGEMSLLDSGIRFSACTTITDCEVAILSTEAMDQMMTADPSLAARLIAVLARKLSLRLRVVSARLSDRK
ncbi:MAG TPA: cyclic nucleotide-binding domain-containing protein [Burkholderiaceae bacterium]|jgi:CRP-like cAMP-binding protein|nr:cyclic nucleotide-binding domain-containing protein [Rhodoferax sp.]HNW00821.1 cyclic nucleotide-binding domain-containing protein [Burkholderiaceae bacterium]MBK7548642.1 cyclic nucleotide-binding domain-containing protein [Rhodoferax sp.]MBP6493371.1 cyclic nucleotide-binding domain-containing protein [Rhodoferax sp.]MBP7572790.1 cyclic nucleotide-binding domain-containing protein [Rhodoferax sp.]